MMRLPVFSRPHAFLAAACFLLAEALAPSPTALAADPTPGDQAHGQVVHLFWKKEEIYDHNRQTVTLTGGARAQRGDMTVDADTLIGYLRPKKQAAGTSSTDESQKNGGSSDMELYRVEAFGHVHIYNLEDQGWGDHGLYDVDRAVLLMTGKAMKFTTPRQLMTARDLVEYHPQTHTSIGWGEATVNTSDGKRITADVMQAVELSDAQKAANRASQAAGGEKSKSGNLDRAYGWGHVVIRTDRQTATGDRGVYLAGPELARLIGHVRVTQGQNQNNGSQAIVNMKTGVSHMLSGSSDPVQGLIVPNEAGK
ncbi:LptA/OstA family protein [Parasaccharibacter sp. TMW 2.1888]|uniref:LptA/OstA family protein n=1 Tax=Parasaccharibacter sp. TMW 2.1888 TaxID=2268025 RepID=UPI0020BEE253|nr:LptA/OstA family protein [Parasaccharibacter sp. TMW 2.1888]